MKKLIVLMAAMISISFAHAQHISGTAVPAIVKSALHKQHPNIKELKWEKENGHYEAEFKEAATSYAVLITASGSILETEVTINMDALPAAAKNYIAKAYPGKEIKEAARITDAKGVMTYEAEVNGKDLIFDNTGKFVQEVKD